MIRHIVLLRLESTCTAADLQGIVDALRALPEQIPAIRSFQAGSDAGLSEGNVQLCAVADFDDVAGYESYRDHPAHKQVIADHIKPVLVERTAIQVEL
ncbi:MAG: Dabb family protein [Microthrixaceae bacterium]|nr:Dabb family protein [Microthrixaceae bacterium]MCB1011449.1 Dabb family protein [Microthrixaceae bacterium]MCO5320023.1 Dabb family protein [Microthrixaceae bacterium]